MWIVAACPSSCRYSKRHLISHTPPPHVGLNETQAKEDDVAFEVTRYDLGELDRAIAEGEAHSFVKVLTVPGNDKILGTIHAYPTLIEANKFAAGEWKRAHAPERVLAWLARFHAWRRG